MLIWVGEFFVDVPVKESYDKYPDEPPPIWAWVLLFLFIGIVIYFSYI